MLVLLVFLHTERRGRGWRFISRHEIAAAFASLACLSRKNSVYVAERTSKQKQGSLVLESFGPHLVGLQGHEHVRKHVNG